MDEKQLYHEYQGRRARSATNKSKRVLGSYRESPVSILMVGSEQIKYDPILWCKPRNNGIDLISISVEVPRNRTTATVNPARIYRDESRQARVNDEEATTRRGMAKEPSECDRDARSDLHSLEVYIERRMSDVQRARHVEKSPGVESR
ncbi:hypothetical protein K0M31_016040 [Melipona bicolor]|uniref:Uncharacterized protein n=1 Tax=Melipona bicolor TaxID=60889 RepID=A0AA40KTA6_9HYME|nr:hypothetical protein K0M31_016040 [Melipona bicolor]